MPAVGIAAGVRPGAAPGNPLEMMKQMMDLRNTQQQFNANVEAGQILATSPDMDTAIDKLRQSPSAAWQIPIINQIREGQLTQANIARAGAETYRTRYQTGIDALHDAIKLSTTPDSLVRTIANARKRLDPNIQAEVGGLYDDVQQSLLGNLPSDPDEAVAEFQRRQTALRIGSGLTSTEAFGALGYPAPGVTRIPGVMGGPDRLVQYGGIPSPTRPGAGAPAGATAPPGGFQPLGPEPATQPQMDQAKSLEENQSGLRATVQSGNQAMQNINKAEELLSRFDTSSLSERRATLAGFAQAFGMDPKQVAEIAGGDLSSMQEFMKYLAGISMQRLTGSMPPGGRLNLPETEAWLAANPNINMQKTAIQDIFNSWRRQHISNVIQQRILGQYINDNAQNPRAAGLWPDFWQGIVQRKGLNDPHFYVTGSNTHAIPETVIMDLMGNPTEANKRKFDEKYGPGSAARFTENQ